MPFIISYNIVETSLFFGCACCCQAYKCPSKLTMRIIILIYDAAFCCFSGYLSVYRFDYSNSCKDATAKCEDIPNACFDAEYYCEKSAERLEAGSYCIAIAMLFLATFAIGISALVIYSRFSKTGCCRPVPIPASEQVAGL